MILSILCFVIILGIIVFVHEFGHFFFAKLFGIYVYEFAIGMGPRIFKFKRKNDETTYAIRLFPIGGFVQMAGEEVEENKDIPKEKQLGGKPSYQRFLIMVAGVMMNFLLAIILLFFLGLFNGVSLDNTNVVNSEIKDLKDNSKIIAIDNHFVNNYDKLALELTIVGDKEFVMSVKENGKVKDVKVKPISVGEDGLIFKKDYGFSVDDLTVKESKNANISTGDKIISVNGVAIETYLGLLKQLDTDDSKVVFTFNDKNKQSKEVVVNVKEKKDDTLSGNSYGFYISGKEEKGFFAAFKYAFLKFFSSLEQMIFTIFYLITGKISLSMLSGPVGIFNAVSVYSKYGISNLISLLCLICINVGFINLLPLPAFDGGHVLFIIIEKIKGSRVDPKVENMIHTIGLVLLMILMVIVTYSDIKRMFF